MRRTIGLFLVTMLTVVGVLGATSATIAEKTQGCTPGYWKQTHHFDDWVGFSPTDKFADVFGVDHYPGDPSLLKVLRRGGGGYVALGRHVVAGLLSTAHPDVDYSDAGPDGIIAYVSSNWPSTKKEANAFKREFEAINELGCPL